MCVAGHASAHRRREDEDVDISGGGHPPLCWDHAEQNSQILTEQITNLVFLCLIFIVERCEIFFTAEIGFIKNL